MDHRYIDESSVAERYLDHTLPSCERLEFEAHVVDCQECADRLLLAGMFHHRNGSVHAEAPTPAFTSAKPPSFLEHRKERKAFRIVFTPWQLIWMLAVAAILPALVISGWLLWGARP